MHAWVICLQFTANGAAPWFCVLVTSQETAAVFPVSSFEGEIQILIIHLSQLTGLTCESCFTVNFLPQRCMKNFQERQRGDKFHSPGPPADFYLSVKHLSWMGTEGGAAVWSPEVFSLAVECFRCGTLSVRSFKGKRLFQKQESASNNMATHGPCWRCRVLLSVAKREYTQQTVCVCVCICNNWTLSISQWWIFDWADVAYSFLNECKCFTLYLQTSVSSAMTN